MLRWTIALGLLGLIACTPSFSPPREALRVSGVVKADGGAPVDVMVFERCSPRLYFFEKCPGKFLGEAKINRPGDFLVEIDSGAAEISLVAFRGVAGEERECVLRNVRTDELRKEKPILELEPRRCPIELPTPLIL